jgi:hypothetical protein
MKIFSLIPKIMEDVGAISKTRQMAKEAGGYAFRGIEDMYSAVHPAFVKHGVFCAPEVIEAQNTVIEGTNSQGLKKTSFRTLLRVKHWFYASDGSSVTVTTQGEGVDSGDKASNKAMSQAMKYAFIELLSIPTKDIEDPDRNNANQSQASDLQTRLASFVPPKPKQGLPVYNGKSYNPNFDREPGSDE